MSPSDTSLIEEEGANVDEAERDGVEREGRAAKSNYRDRNCALLCLTIAASMVHMTEKWSEEGKGTEKWHRHVYESKTFSKSLIWCKLTITPIRRTLVESRDHLVFGHNPQTLTSEVVRMLYPQDTKHIRNKLPCHNNARTSNAGRKERY